MFRILAIDGGGIKGTFAASALATFEKELGGPISDYFDLIAGTSTGSIIAIGLGLGLTAEQLLTFYRERGPVIFPLTRPVPKFMRTLQWTIRAKYSQDVLYAELDKAFQQKLFGESTKRLIIPSYDVVEGRLFLFKTPHHPRFTQDSRIPAAKVALASASAPTFFKATGISEHEGCEYVDGGLWANSPALAAVVEAHCFLGQPLDQIQVLSIGATYSPGSVRKLADRGLIGWGAKVVELLMTAQVEAAQAQAMLLVGREHFTRINALTVPGEYRLDSAKDINALAALGRGEAAKKLVHDEVTERFFAPGKVAPFARVSPGVGEVK